MFNRMDKRRDLAASTRAAAIAQLMHFIQAEDLDSANEMLQYFKQNGQRVSRDVLFAYWRHSHHCQAA